MQWPSWAFWRQKERPKENEEYTVDDRQRAHLTSTPLDKTLNKTNGSYFTTTQTIVISALTTVTALASIRFYKTYVRRIPSTEYLKPGFFRKRTFYGYVTRVGDGDNFHFFHTPGGRLLGWGWAPHRRIKDMMDRAAKAKAGQTLHVRIAGIDAPEGAHFGRPAQPYSKEALDWLRDTILKRYVRVYPFKQDQYQRVVCSVHKWKWGFFKSDVGLNMIKQGLATVYEAKIGSEFGGREEQYRAAEARAKQRKIGMWQDPGLIKRFLGQGAEVESPRAYKKRMSQQEKADKTSDMAK
jgi:endonuclease YncB( thermonuclease family)